MVIVIAKMVVVPLVAGESFSVTVRGESSVKRRACLEQ